MRMKTGAAVLTATALLAGCGGDEGSGRTAMEAAEDLQAEVDGVAELVEITEDNDPNNLIGRPNGHEAAVVVKDDRIDDCGSDIGVICGATIEEFEDSGDAEERKDYIEGLLEDAPMLGSEYLYLDGPLLLRVSGDLPPSAAEEYEEAF